MVELSGVDAPPTPTLTSGRQDAVAAARSDVMDMPTFVPPEEDAMDAPLPRRLHVAAAVTPVPAAASPSPVPASAPAPASDALVEADWVRLSVGLGIAAAMAAVLAMGLLLG